MRLANGLVFPIPVTLPVDPGDAIRLDQELALRNAKNELLAVMTIDEIYEWDRINESQKVFGTTDLRHPLVAEMHRWGPLNVSGRLQVLQLPQHYDFRELRLTPGQTRARLEGFGYRNVVAFQTRNPLHRVHEELTKRAVEDVDGVLFLHPVVGMTKPGDVDQYTRVRTYKMLAEHYYDRSAGAAPAGHAPGRSTRGGVARPHPAQLWRQPLDRGSRSCQPRGRLEG
jgi:sulfate adenylyltransferase